MEHQVLMTIFTGFFFREYNAESFPVQEAMLMKTNEQYYKKQCYFQTISSISCTMEDNVFEIEKILQSSVRKVSFVIKLKNEMLYFLLLQCKLFWGNKMVQKTSHVTHQLFQECFAINLLSKHTYSSGYCFGVIETN